jgi:hypothetical protein
MTYRLEGTIQNNTIWIDKHKKIPLKYNIPTGPLQSVCYILMALFVFIYPDRVILYCPLQSVCYILMGFFCVYLSRSCYFVKYKKIPLKYDIPTGGDNTK